MNSFLRLLKAEGAILGGEAWWDDEINPVDSLAQGKMSVNFDHEVPAPLTDLRFYMSRNSGYYLKEFAGIAA